MFHILLLTALLQSPPASRPSCSAPEHRQFDFWIGDWVVHDPSGQQVGTNVITRVEGGCALEERWTATSGGTGRSLNAYRRLTGEWHQTWIDSNGSVLLLDGKFAGGKMVLEGTGKLPNGDPVMNRITWSPLDGGAVRQVWEQSTDGGRTWSTAFDGRYTQRKQAPSDAGRWRRDEVPMASCRTAA